MWSVLFGLREPVSRRTYAIAGFTLLSLKYAVDVAIVMAFTGEIWSPLGYVAAPWSSSLPVHPSAIPMLGLLGVWALPFAWIGISMTMRRCVDAGLSPGYGLFFFVPVLNVFGMVALCLIPSRDRPGLDATARRTVLEGRWRARFAGAIAGVAVLVCAMVISVFGLGSYGVALFLGAPFLGGFVAAFVLRRNDAEAGLRESGIAAWASLFVASTVFLLVAWEGVICMFMASLPALALASLGAWIGHNAAGGLVGRSAGVALLVCWPMLAAAESHVAQPELRAVLSVIEIERPPTHVWPHVIAFSEIPEPDEWYFRAGIAHPQRAHIEGVGEGAVRYCEFSTGPFVEPITAWEAPTRLAFTVAKQPPPMSELSPYREVLAPHLDGNLRSHRGEFQLVELPGGTTRVEARTWYSVDMYPNAYWHLWADSIIHAIHMRVLRHIRAEATGNR